LLVADSKRRQQVWRALSGPGALLVDGEVAGTWRYRRSDHELTISPFESLGRAQRTKAENNAHLIARATNDDPPKVTWDSEGARTGEVRCGGGRGTTTMPCTERPGLAY
jgi:hypothetical protein